MEAAHYQILIMYLIATCLFLAVFTNVFILHRVAFDAGKHVLRIDRFIEIMDEKKQKSNDGWDSIPSMIRTLRTKKLRKRRLETRDSAAASTYDRVNFVELDDNDDNTSTQPMDDHYTASVINVVPTNRITILTRQFASNSSDESGPFFQVVQVRIIIIPCPRNIRRPYQLMGKG